MKKGLQIVYKKNDGSWEQGIVNRRTGKATGKYKNCWEVLDKGTGNLVEFDVENDWQEWKAAERLEDIVDTSETNEDIFIMEDSLTEKKQNEVLTAKRQEI